MIAETRIQGQKKYCNAAKGVSGWKRGPSKTPKGVERDPPSPLEEIEWEPPRPL